MTWQRNKILHKIWQSKQNWIFVILLSILTVFRLSDVEKIRDGISEKVGHFIYLVIGFLITVAISFAYGWKLTLAVSVYIPIVIVLNIVVAKVREILSN